MPILVRLEPKSPQVALHVPVCPSVRLEGPVRVQTGGVLPGGGGGGPPPPPHVLEPFQVHDPVPHSPGARFTHAEQLPWSLQFSIIPAAGQPPGTQTQPF